MHGWDTTGMETGETVRPVPHPVKGGGTEDAPHASPEHPATAPAHAAPAPPKPPSVPALSPLAPATLSRVALLSRRAATTAKSALCSAWNGLVHWWQPPHRRPTGERFHRSTGWGPPPATGGQGFTARQAGQGGGDSNGTVAQAAVRSGTPKEDLF